MEQGFTKRHCRLKSETGSCFMKPHNKPKCYQNDIFAFYLTDRTWTWWTWS